MSTKAIKPIPVNVPLAKTPTSKPRYSVSVKSQKGNELTLADPNATRALVALMDMQAVMGGAASHFGGPAAFAELMSATYALAFQSAQDQGVEWYEAFNLVNDAGHCENGLYSLKANYGMADLSLERLKTFRSLNSPLTGHGEVHLFPEGVYLSNGPLGSSLPQAQGLAMADALMGKTRVTVTAISDGACMEGEAKEALAAIPGFAAKKQMAPFVLVISDNNTKLSGRIDKDSFSMEPSFNSLEQLGWNVIKVADGNNLEQCLHSLEQAFELAQSDPTKPVAIHAKTIKGFGIKKLEESASGGHGFPLKDPSTLKSFLEEIYQGSTVPEEMLSWCEELVNTHNAKTPSTKSAVVKEKVQVGVAKAMIQKRSEGWPVVSISADLQGSTGVLPFHKEFPENSYEVGVAESNMVSAAAGFSKEGFIPVVDTFSQFGVTKGALPFIMANLSEAPVIAVFSHVGFQDAADGASHQALSYFAMTSSLPHTDVYALTCSNEAEALVGQAIEEFGQKRKKGETPRTKIFFLGRENFPQTYGAKDYKLGKSQVVFNNTGDFDKSVTIAAGGALLEQGLEAAAQLAKENIGSVVVNPSTINQIDLSTMKECLGKTSGNLLTVEDHQVIGGLGSSLIHSLVQAGVSLKADSLGVKDEFGQSAYTAIELYKKHKLDAGAIVESAKGLI